MSRSLVKLTKGTQVTVHSALPDPTEKEGLKIFISSVNSELSYTEAERQFMNGNKPSSLIHRLAKPHQIANVVTFLASECAGGRNAANHRLTTAKSWNLARTRQKLA
ncbi:hypothetical protein RugamoR64_31210 [Duganella rhizosphaerae]|uniref:hypothetical protein n=1 Tax=Duganella rhizosphaerae TaxID=2885763 RepID=UPI0030E8C078